MVIDNGLKNAGHYVFTNCTNLTDIIIPNNMTSISDGMFDKCISLTSITIPNSVTDIGFYAFAHCENLKNINFKGTRMQWKKILLGYQWNYETPIKEIICTDGIIQL